MIRSRAVQVRPGIGADVLACLGLDLSYTTSHVWQMERHGPDPAGDEAILTSFRPIRLPRPLTVDPPRDQSLVAKAGAHGPDLFLVAENPATRQIEGYVEAEMVPWQRHASLILLGVAPDARRRGVGTALLAGTRDWARRRRLRALLIALSTKNYPAIRFAQKSGFLFCGFNDHYYPNRDIAVLFVYKL